MKNSFKSVQGAAKVALGLLLVGGFANTAVAKLAPSTPANSTVNVQEVDATNAITPTTPVKAVPLITFKDIQETESIPYTSSSVNDSQYDNGKTYIKVQGSAGQKVKTYKVEYSDGKEVARTLAEEVVSVPATNEVIANGTKVPVVAPTYQTPATSSITSSSAYYANCTAARAAGAAPLRIGEPGYRSALDRDSDGIACE